MKKYLFLITVPLFALILSGCSYDKNNPSVKKSSTGICHQKGSEYYEKTKNFTSYDSINDCVSSGGRLPKR